jgi:hypothetical protein
MASHRSRSSKTGRAWAPDLGALVRRQAPRRLLDGIEFGDAPDGLVGDGRALRLMHIDELAPDMGHACDLTDITGAIQVFEPGIAIGMHPATISGQVILRVFAFAVR